MAGISGPVRDGLKEYGAVIEVSTLCSPTHFKLPLFWGTDCKSK